MKTRPIAFTTSAPPWITQPLPGLPGGRFSGRTQYSSVSISLRKLRWSQTWFPFVMTSAPASWISRAISPVSPAPPAAFSPLTMTMSILCSRFSAGTSAATACRPGFPTTSPTKRTLTEALFGVLHRAGLADHGDFDLTGVLQRVLDLLRDVARKTRGLQVVELFGLHDDADLATRLDRERFL